MDELHWVDELYLAFCQTLPGMLHAEAQGLAHTLGLTPSRGIPWSRVFSHEITLAAPSLVAEAMPELRGSTVQDALLAHMLAVIAAFGTDRAQDGQVRLTWQLETLLVHARRARDLAIARVASVDFDRADEETFAAIATERALLAAGEPVSLARYKAVSLAKQRVGLPASIALARAAGWPPRRIAGLSRMLDAVCLGLQIHDDVVDWEDDHGRGGAWAMALARALSPATALPAGGDRSADPPEHTGLPAGGAHAAVPSSRSRSAVPAHVRRFVLESGALAAMLGAARRCFREARLRAAALGARRIATWAESREAHIAELARCEAESPGYTNRARALSAWAREVLT